MSTDEFAPSEVVKPVLPSDLLLVCWGCFDVEEFHSEFVVALVEMINFVSVAEMCFFARCGRYG